MTCSKWLLMPFKRAKRILFLKKDLYQLHTKTGGMADFTRIILKLLMKWREQKNKNIKYFIRNNIFIANAMCTIKILYTNECRKLSMEDYHFQSVIFT